MEKKRIIVIISGGVVQGFDNIPEDVEIEVRDYDVQDEDENSEYHDIFRDDEGNLYERDIWNSNNNS